MFGLSPPSDLEAETALLGSMLFDPSAIDAVDNIVRSADFHSVENGVIHRAIIAIHITGARPDAKLLHDELRRVGKLDEVGGLAYLLEITESVPHAANAVYYADTVHRHSLRRQAMLRARDIMLRAADDGEDPTTLMVEAARSFETIGRSASTESRFKVLDMAELATADHRVNYLVEGILVEGQPCIIGGPQKALKTCMALALFLALATGDMFLGKFRVSRRCRTLLLSGESGLATIQETLNRIAAADGYTLSDVDGLHVCSTIPRLDRDEDLAELRRIIQQHKIEVIGIDPVYLAMPSTDTSNLFAQGELLRRVGELCEGQGCTLVLLHHVKRAAGTTHEPIELADLSYAGFAEFARQWILVRRREKYSPGSGDHRLWLTVGGSAGHNSLWATDVNEGAYAPGSSRIWDASVRPSDEVRKNDREQAARARAEKQKDKEAADLEHAKKEVVAHLVQHPIGDTKRGIRDGTGLRKALVDSAVAALLQGKVIVSSNVVKNNRGEHGFKFPEKEPTHDE